MTDDEKINLADEVYKLKEILRKLFKRHEKSNPTTTFYTDLLKNLGSEISVPKEETVSLEKPSMVVKENPVDSLQNSKPPRKFKHDHFGVTDFHKRLVENENTSEKDKLGTEKEPSEDDQTSDGNRHGINLTNAVADSKAPEQEDVRDKDNAIGKAFKKVFKELDNSKSPSYLDLGTISVKDGELHTYTPSEFVCQLNNGYFSIYGIICKEDKKPPSICTLQEQKICFTYNSVFCLYDKITTCMYGKTELETQIIWMN
ncbi:hypothetical protein LCGC14_1556450 [marine sediment metagenome]|uniref:Uncharacterized protein n=1 Tax=marine sediment metagenome TaxID=412755 RepID=A0A0F9INQ4_9ZZZZ